LLTSTTDPGGLNLATTFTYDARGNRLTVTDPLNRTTTSTYDVRGNVTKTTLPDTREHFATYDALNRQLTTTDPKNQTITHSYWHETGNTLTLKDAKNQTTTWTYNLRGQILTKTYPIWHLIRTRINEAWLQGDWSSLERLGVDETSNRKGHKYGTVFLEISGKETARGRGASKVARLLFFTPGKDKETFTQFAAELERRGVPTAQVNEIAMDMSKAFIAGAAEHFPEAQLCFDRFHVMKLCGESLDAIRKEVAREHGGLPRGAMWALRGNPENLKEEQRNLREQICKEHGKIARALSIREFLADLWNYQLREDAEQHLQSILSWCSRSRKKPFVKLAADKR